jgi:Right handed beta helix region
MATSHSRFVSNVVSEKLVRGSGPARVGWVQVRGGKLSALVAVLVIAMTLTTVGSPPPAEAGEGCTPSKYRLKVSASSTRSGAVDLCGQQVSGEIYVFLAPMRGLARVRFKIDGVVQRIDHRPPWDLVGGKEEIAVAMDATALAQGVHGISAVVTRHQGAVHRIRAHFTVTVSDSTTRVDVTPAPSPTPTASPTPWPTPSPTPSTSPSPSSTPTPTPTPSPSPSPSPPSPTPSPSPMPSSSPSTCSGVGVAAGNDLMMVMGSHPAGTTYCLAAGTFKVTSTIKTDVGDRVIGAGRDDTFIDGSALPETASGIFSTNSSNLFANLDISGAPTPAAGSGVFCSPNPNCGKAFRLGGSSLTLQSIDCHDNGQACVAGGGGAELIANDIDCFNNGNAYSMTPAFRSAACIKRAAIDSSGGNTTVTNSYIHDNAWAGIWCDFCKYGLFDIESNFIINNGADGIQWEMSGGWTSEDRAVIRNNVIGGNNYLESASFRGGIGISTANDILVSGNTFGGDLVAGVNIIFSASRNPPQPDSRGVVVQNNTLNGGPIMGCALSGVSCTDNL